MQEKIREAINERILREEQIADSAKTARYLSIYYAVFAASAAVLSAIYPTGAWHALSSVMTVLLSLMVIFLCAQKYEARAQLVRRDRSELERLLDEAERDGADEASVRQRMQMLTASGASASSQERRAFERSQDRAEKWFAACEGRPARPNRLFGYEKFLYWFIEIARLVCLVLMLLLPVVGIALAACGLL